MSGVRSSEVGVSRAVGRAVWSSEVGVSREAGRETLGVSGAVGAGLKGGRR